jgi:anthranilate/para-aminobenzoate synthase component I
MRGRAYEADLFFWLAWPTSNSTSASDQINQALEVSPNHQPQNGRGLRIQAGLNFEKYTAAVLNAHKHVKAGLVFEVAERNIPPLPRLCLEALVYEI